LLQVLFTLSANDVVQLEKKAKTFGLSVSAYIRQIVLDSFRPKESKSDQREGGQEEILLAIRALIPVAVDAMARTSAKPPSTQEVEQLTAVLLKKWEEKH
jgi:hypothetical protein